MAKVIDMIIGEYGLPCRKVLPFSGKNIPIIYYYRSFTKDFFWPFWFRLDRVEDRQKFGPQLYLWL